MSSDRPFDCSRHVQGAACAIPAYGDRRISFMAWSAVLLGGSACWAAFLWMI